jgi:acetyl-CoA carboxylase carboxyltransferase component
MDRIAGGAYLPALSDVILMVKGTSFMGLGGPNLVKGATGQVIDSESLGGAVTHTAISGVAHYALDDDDACLKKIRELVARLPTRSAGGPPAFEGTPETSTPPHHLVPDRVKSPPTAGDTLYDLLPADHRMSYDMHAVLRAIADDGALDEFQGNLAAEMICADARIQGIPWGSSPTSAGSSKAAPAKAPLRGIVYAESAEKVAFYIDRCDRQGIPLLFVQDVSGFMVGPEAEHEGIIRAGARFVEAMACARVPKLVLTVNHASGAGYYAMAGQGFDPDFIFSWPTGRMGVMEGEAAIQAVHGTALDEAKKQGRQPSKEVQQNIEEMREDYEHQLDARFAAARGYVDAIVYPDETRDVIAMALRTSLHNPGPHIGPFVLPTAGARSMKPVTRCIGTGFWVTGLRRHSVRSTGARRLPDARLPGGSHDVDPAEAEGARPENGVRARLRRSDRLRARWHRHAWCAGRGQCRRGESAWLRRCHSRPGRPARRARQALAWCRHRRRPLAASR